MGETQQPAETAKPRVLVITAYYKEERALIERTIRSVAGQTAALSGAAVVDHMLVADGFPQDWIDGQAVRHIRLDRAHADYGNTPRGVGSVLGISEGYDAICYCDADNWYEPTHVAACLDAAAKGGEEIDYVIARRTMRRPDETIIPIRDEPVESHVDTNCFFFLPGAFHLIHHFAAIPREMSVIGDRLFFAALKLAGLKVVLLTRPTVNYLCLWIPIYRAVGEIPPEGSKPAADTASAERWLAGLAPRRRAIVSRLTGLPLGGDAAAPEEAPARRILAITPYHREDRAMLERCLASVAAQSVAVDHVVVADGFPQDWIDGAGVRHLRLDRAHGDFGNTPRGVGAMLAISEGYDGFFFLDADNRLEPDHVEACLAAAATTPTPCDWVMARRFYVRPDGSRMPIGPQPRDIDTNCLFFLAGSFHLVHRFAQQPRELAVVGDVVFHDAVLVAAGLVSATVPKQTLDYLCMWETTYRFVGEEPPPGARPAVDPAAIGAWARTLSPRRKLVVERLTGMRL